MSTGLPPTDVPRRHDSGSRVPSPATRIPQLASRISQPVSRVWDRSAVYRYLRYLWTYRLTAGGKWVIAGMMFSAALGSATVEIPVYQIFLRLVRAAVRGPDRGLSLAAQAGSAWRFSGAGHGRPNRHRSICPGQSRQVRPSTIWDCVSSACPRVSSRRTRKRRWATWGRASR